MMPTLTSKRFLTGTVELFWCVSWMTRKRDWRALLVSNSTKSYLLLLLLKKQKKHYTTSAAAS
jgi:hypothetical protein